MFKAAHWVHAFWVRRGYWLGRDERLHGVFSESASRRNDQLNDDSSRRASAAIPHMKTFTLIELDQCACDIFLLCRIVACVPWKCVCIPEG